MIANSIFCRLVIATLLYGLAIEASVQMQMKAVTVADGLSQGYVSCLLQDKQGFIWIGTFDGLNRYDGYSIKHYPTKPFEPWSLYSSSSITSLYEDDRQLLWIGTAEGLYVFDPLRERFFYLSLPEYNLPSNTVQTITGDTQGNIYVHISMDADAAGLFRLCPSAGFLHKIQQLEAPSVNLTTDHILTDSLHFPLTLLQYIGDSMLVAYDNTGQFFRYKAAENRFKSFNVLNLPANKTVDHSILWAKNQGYFFRRRLPTGRDSLLSIQGRQLALRLKDGSVGTWISANCTFLRKTTNAPLRTDIGLIKPVLENDPSYQAEFNALFRVEHYANNVIMIDRSGVLWAGTGGVGVWKVTPRKLAPENQLPGHSISTIVELPDGRIWGQLFNLIPTLIHPVTLKTIPAIQDPFFKKNRFSNLLVDRAGNYWMINLEDRGKKMNQITLWEQKTDRYTLFALQFPFFEAIPEKMLEDRDGNIWIAAHTGVLLRRRPGQPAFEQFSYARFAQGKLKNFRATALVQDKYGAIWIGTNQGLLKLEGANTAVPQFTFWQHDQFNRQSLSLNWVTCICPDPADSCIMWIGTRGGGLNRLDTRAGQFSYFSEEAGGLPDNVVYGILPDDRGNLWCSTNRGLCRFNPDRKTFVTYGQADGALNTEYNTNSFLRSRDGRMWFGGVNGITVLQPDELQSNSPPPPVAITSIKVLGAPRLPDSPNSLTLGFDENNVTFSFAVLDFTNPAANRFRYRLHGIDAEWVYTGTIHGANYASLPPGQYTLELQGKTADSQWSEPGTKFQLTILTPWYRNWLAWLVYVLVSATLVTGYVRYRESMLKLRYSLATNQRESDQLREFAAFKNKFLANITHEFRTPLTVILGLAERMKRGEQGENIVDHAQNIAKQGNDLLDLTNQMLDLARIDSQHFALHIYNGNISKFVRQHVKMLLPLAAGKGVFLEVPASIPGMQMDFDPLQLRKICNNLIANAIRHTPANGLITVEIEQTLAAQQVCIRVSDTGEGIAAEDLPRIFDRFYQGNSYQSGSSGIGLALTRELVELMGGTILVESTPGLGSTFSVYLPVTNDAPPLNDQHPVAVQPDQDVTPQVVPENPDLPLLLVIEDNAAISAHLRLCLQDHFRLIFATDGEQGITNAITAVPDLIVTDVAMPVKNGYEVAATLKRDIRTSHIPIVMLTAKVEQEDRLEGHRQGANAYLTKPFNDQELLLVLQNLRQLRQQWEIRYSNYVADQYVIAHTETAEVQMEDGFMQKVFAIFETNYRHDTFNLERLCRELGMSSSQLDRKLSALTNQSPMNMLRSFRLQKARTLLLTMPELHINEVCFRTGFKTPSHFSRVFSREFGISPSEIGK